MKSDLTGMGDASWWVTVRSEEKTFDPPGYIQTVDVDGYSRECTLRIAHGYVRPKINTRARITVKSGHVVFPILKVRRQSER